ncbi:type IX secretion system outer membrane channel protein PorV [Thermophagus sp. OGC60D27]|uniref:type IX secretion system outer membrane channel protein PorV n=1 Tax=Thermophagus sp. OGC60D27 TaxID=3458415 RepID=UPI004037CF87
MERNTLRKLIFLFILLNQLVHAQAQDGQLSPSDLGGQVNIISTAVPFLEIAPESRGGGMGNTGVATSPDVNSQHWNPAKYAFIQQEMGAAVSYTPWLRKLVNDINLYYLAGYKRLDNLQTVSASLRYFSLGDIIFNDEAGTFIGNATPNEFAIDIAYSRILSQHFSGAVAFRYIRSDLQLALGSYSGSETYEAGNSFAADLAFYYQNEIELGGRDGILSAGLNISNIGTKLSYGGDDAFFIPTNLKLGAAYSTQIDEYNQVSLTIDLNKLLVPTPNDDSGYITSDASVVSGIFRSFSDAPRGLEEELEEINISVGAEYLYAQQFAIRAGYFHEHENKGNRKFFTAGVGIKFNMLNIDASYIIPVVQNNPLANTVRFTLGFDLDQMIGNN